MTTKDISDMTREELIELLKKQGLTTSTSQDIMTSEESENDRRYRETVSADISRASGKSRDILQGEQEERVPGNESRRQSQRSMPVTRESSAELRRESDEQRMVGPGSVEYGNQARNIGVGDRLDSDIPHDIILDSHSDIGADETPTRRFDTNLQIIRLVKQLEQEGRKATPSEQAIIAKYSGFGDSAYNQAFPRYGRYENEAWRQRGEELKELVTDQEYERIERSRLNAFYTTPEVINTMWKALERMGVDNINTPRILEPSAGSGRFLGYQPKELASRSQRVAVELDPLTSQVLKHIYPDTEVYNMGYQDAPIGDDSVDIAISNVPFGDFPVVDRSFKGSRRAATRQIHNYFFVKSLDHVRPGGVIAFITSHYTLDSKKAKPIRELLAEKADMLGAIRLPKTAFPDTEVVTDVIFMRKRMPGDNPGDQSWVDTTDMELSSERHGYVHPVTVNINKYFIDNPDMVLGKNAASGSMYGGDEYTVEPTGDLREKLSNSVRKLPENIIQDAPKAEIKRGMPLPTGMNVRNGSRIIGEDGDIYYKRGSELVKDKLSDSDKSRVIAMLGVRDAAREVLNVQLKAATDDELLASQNTLNEKYNEFVSSYGTLNSKQNKELMRGDPDEPFLRALENDKTIKPLLNKAALNENEANSIKMPIFTRRVIRGLQDKEVTSEKDAMTVVYNETGRLELSRISDLLGKTEKEVRDSLSEQGLIYKNPKGDWEEVDEYLTGDVREKLREAESAASANKAYDKNVAALKAVQPEDLPPSQITAPLGAPWIPNDVVNQFVRELLNTWNRRWRDKGEYYKYLPETGDWLKNEKYEGDRGLMYSEWGTDRMGADEIIYRILNGKSIVINDKDSEGNTVRNPVATLAAQEKAAAINRKFDEWIWSDTDRATQLAELYNNTFNGLRPRTFDGSHMILPGIREEWASLMHPHQKDATWRVVQDRDALLAHEVGFGKTAVMVASGMELRRLGLANKNLYVVPKATHGQFVEQFRDIYPYANILAPDDQDFTPGKRQEFISRATTGDWDAIILADSQFRRIPVKPETEARLLREEVRNYRAALQEIAETEGNRSQSHKQIQKALERLESKLKEKQAQVGDISDNTMYFEDMGVDQLFVDEADMYKNLRFATKMGRLKGLPNTDSDRAWDMYQKIRHLQSKGKGHGVVFATGTPVANTIAEMYTQMRYLQPDMLEAKNLQHFDAWASTFGHTTESLEQTPTGQYKLTQRFAKFINTPELSNIWQQVADIRVADEVPGIVAKRPRLVDEEGKPRRTVIAVEPDDQLLAYMKTLEKRADELKNVDPRDDNMLKIANDARMASLDMRMVDSKADANPHGKIPTAANKIAEIYHETTPDKGTQLVFLDLGTPKSSDKAEPVDDSDEYSETADEQKVLRNVYGVLKDNLVAKGIPADEIAFIHEAKDNKQKIKLQERVNNGDIRVIIGSTGKMGVGVNVQKRAAAAHHLDAPWRPRDIEQREGRVIRQGNEVYGPKKDEYGNIIDSGKGVRIYTYVTERSFDAYMWQAIEAKSKAIKSIMRREAPPRAIEDIDSFTMSASEAKALASGNPDVLKAVTVKNDVTRLQMLKASHTDSLVRAREQLKTLPGQITNTEDSIKKLEKDSSKVDPDRKFSIKIGNSVYDDRPDASKDLHDNLIKLPESDKLSKVGEYQGFDIKANNQAQGIKVIIENPETGFTHVAFSLPVNELTAAGVMQRIVNKVNGIPTSLAATKQELETHKRNLETYKQQAERKFEYTDRLEKAQKELERLEAKLKGEEGVSNVPIEYDEVTEETIQDTTPTYRMTPGLDKELEQQPPPVEPPSPIEQEIKEETKEAEKTYQKPVIKIEEEKPKPQPIISQSEFEKQIEEKRTPEKRRDIEAEIERRKQLQEQIAKTLEEIPKPIVIEKQKEKYYLHLRDKKWKEVDGETLNVPGYEEFQFFIHKDENDPDKWTASEAKTGSLITSAWNTKDTAIERATKRIQSVDKDGLKRLINTGIEREGISPKYKEPEKPKIVTPQISSEDIGTSPIGIEPVKLRKPRKPRQVKKNGAVESKKKPTKKQKRVKVPLVRDIKAVQAERTPRAIAMDNAKSHKVTIDRKSPRVQTWLNNPGRADIEGIDTKKNKPISQTRKPISESTKAISRRPGPISQSHKVRISPKAGRLR